MREIRTIHGVKIVISYHEDYFMGKYNGFWRADRFDNGETITWDRDIEELIKDVKRILSKKSK